jgi:hypothetical protein
MTKPWNIMSNALREYAEADGPSQRIVLVTQLLSGRDTREMVPWHLKSLLDEALALRAAAVREIEKERAACDAAEQLAAEAYDERDRAEEVPRKCRGGAEEVPLRYRAPAEVCGCEICLYDRCRCGETIRDAPSASDLVGLARREAATALHPPKQRGEDVPSPKPGDGWEIYVRCLVCGRVIHLDYLNGGPCDQCGFAGTGAVDDKA